VRQVLSQWLQPLLTKVRFLDHYANVQRAGLPIQCCARDL